MKGLLMSLAMLVINSAASAQNFGSSIPAGNGAPTAQSPALPCSKDIASINTASQYFDRSITVGNPIWNCALGLDLVTYAWQAPYAPSVRFYNAAGTASPIVKCMATTVTSAATTGAYTFNLTSLGITTLLTVQTQSLSSSTAATGLNTAYINSATATTVSGTVNSGAILSILGATLVPQSVATTVYGFFCGT